MGGDTDGLYGYPAGFFSFSMGELDCKRNSAYDDMSLLLGLSTWYIFTNVFIPYKLHTPVYYLLLIYIICFT